MSVEQKVTSLIEPVVANLSYELVRVKQIDQDTIQVMIDKEGGITITDCEKLNKLISPILYVAEISTHYGLEISSPGLDRPLIKPDHFIKFVGSKIKLTTQELIDGQKRFVGQLIKFDPENNLITLATENKTFEIALNQVQSANLLLDIKENNKR